MAAELPRLRRATAPGSEAPKRHAAPHNAWSGSRWRSPTLNMHHDVVYEQKIISISSSSSSRRNSSIIVIIIRSLKTSSAPSSFHSLRQRQLSPWKSGKEIMSAFLAEVLPLLFPPLRQRHLSPWKSGIVQPFFPDFQSSSGSSNSSCRWLSQLPPSSLHSSALPTRTATPSS